MRRMGLLIVLVMFLIVGCSQKSVITEQPGKADISFRESFSVAVKDYEALQEALDEAVEGAMETGAWPGPELYRVVIGETRYLLCEKGIQKGEKTFPLSEASVGSLESAVRSAIATGANTQFKGSRWGLRFEDHAESQSLTESQILLLKEGIQNRNFLACGTAGVPLLYGQVPYPYMKVIMDDELSFTFERREILLFSIQEHIIGYLRLTNDEFYKQMEAEYPEAFERTGLFKHQKAKIHTSYWETPSAFDNATFRLDRLIRIIKEGSKAVAEPDELPGEAAIIFELDGHAADDIRIYENDYWLYQEKHYYKEGLYEEVIAELGAG